MMVAVDDYPRTFPGIAAEIPAMSGAEADIANMGELLKEAGFTVLFTKRRSEAVFQDIWSGLKKMAARAAAGDTVLFYFSGRGSTMAGPNGNVATLVPHDGLATGFDRDISLPSLTHWADRLTGVHVVFVLDACFVKNRGTKDPYYLQAPYNHNPKVLERSRDAAPPAAPTGHAVFLFAADPSTQSSAYEVQYDVGKYEGAFTSSLLGTVQELGRQGYDFPSLFQEIQSQFRRRALDGFMKDEAPVVYGPVESGVPFLWADTLAPEDGRIPKLRVCLLPDADSANVDSNDIRIRWAKIRRTLRQRLNTDPDVIEVVDDLQRNLPDHLVRAVWKTNGWHFSLGGDVDDATWTKKAEAEGDAQTEDQRVDALHRALQIEAYATAIYRLTDHAADTHDVDFTLGGARYRPNSTMEPTLISQGAARRFIWLSCNRDYGLVHLVWPAEGHLGEGDNVLTGTREDIRLGFPSEEPNGDRDVLRAVLVPAGTDPGGDDLVARLRAVYLAIRDRKVAWSKKDRNYVVRR